jgi:putative hydrolase of the HAD superfamily
VGATKTEVVLFDLGGVLVNFRGVSQMGKFSGITDPEELWERWLSCQWVRSFESGRCSEVAFAAGVVDDWQLKMSPAVYLEEFRSWPTGVLPGAEELVGQVKSRVPVSCFSNTNTLHWQYAQTWPLMSLFDHAFLSFQMGMLKPDQDAFEHVASALGVARRRILYLDDNRLNIDAALELGFSAMRVTGVDEARRALADNGVIESSPISSAVRATWGTVAL